uniref:C-CAP/cofactor C-like domain-containing protein n=1 Tax=Meloidogyne hapla TaxID=6305 RepID=A0A1I8AZI3_MELHA
MLQIIPLSTRLVELYPTIPKLGQLLQDIREEQQKDPKEFLWQSLVGETRVKEPGQLGGNPFQIESCLNCTLVLLDQTGSITIDDCRDCLIICGPCKGSLFLRNCKNLLILAICQQFRTRDCRHLSAHLFCTTCPTIEETDLEVAPLLLNYCGLQTQMYTAGISPFSNRWNQVHNFTPDSGKCNVRQNINPKITNSFNSHLIQKLEHFLFNSTKNWQFSMGNLKESKLFVAGLGIKKGQQNEQEEKFLLLIQPKESSTESGGMRFYAEAIEITKELINLEGIKLVAMHDIDMKSGEWENIICGKKENMKNIIGNKSKKIVALEIYEPKGCQTKIEDICQQEERKATIAKLVDSEHMENCRKQLYRLCEIRQSI